MIRGVTAMTNNRVVSLLLGLGASVVARCALATCPTISSVSPNPYIVASGSQITISGSGFCTTSGCNSVTINGVSATVVTGSRSSSGLKVYDPGLGTGSSYDVAVTQSTCAVAHSTITYQNPTPTVSAATDVSGHAYGSTAGGYQITVTGTNFVSGATVCYDGFLCPGTAADSVPSSTQLKHTVNVGTWPPGAGTVRVYNSGPNTPASNILSGWTFVPPPTLSCPATYAGTGSSVSFTFNGSNLPLNPTYCITQFNGQAVGCTAASGTQVTSTTYTMPSTPGDYTLTVYGASYGGVNYAGWAGSSSSPNGLIANCTIDVVGPATISSISTTSPESASGGFAATVTGTNFVPGSAIYIVLNGTNYYFTVTSYTSLTQISALTPAMPAGTYQVCAWNLVGSPGCWSALQYIAPPSNLSIDQPYASTAGGQARAISGIGLGSAVKVDTATVAMSGGVFTTPPHAAGPVALRVYGLSGADYNGIFTDTANGFLTYQAPTNTPTNTSTPTSTPTETLTPTNSPTSSPSDTPTRTPTATPTSTPTATPTSSPTATDTPTNTPTETSTPSPTLTPTPTNTATTTPSETPTQTPTPTNTPSNTPTATETSTSTPTTTATPTDTPTPTATPTPPPMVGSCAQFDLGNALPVSVSGTIDGFSNSMNGASCGDGGSGADVTYQWTAPADGSYVINTLGSEFDTILYVRDAACDGPELGCDDDANEGSQSSLTLALGAGQAVVIIVDGYGGDTGTYQLTIAPAPPPSGDCCSSQDAAFCGNPACVACVCSAAVDPFCCATQWDGLCAYFAVNTCQADCGCSTPLPTPTPTVTPTPIPRDCCVANGGASCDNVTCASCVCAFDSYCCQLRWDVVCAGEAARFCEPACACPVATPTLAPTSTPTRTPRPTVPPGLACPQIDLGSALPVSAIGTTADGFFAMQGASCGDGGANSPDVTYQWTAPADGVYTIHTLGSSLDTILYVRDGGCSGPELACNDDAGAVVQSLVTLQLAAGQTIAIVVDGYGGSVGAYQLSIAAAGDCCAGNQSATCTSAACDACVCAADTYCCTDQWDEWCVLEAADTCESQCGCVSATPTPVPPPIPTPRDSCPQFDLGIVRSTSVSGTTAGGMNLIGGAACGYGGDNAPDATYQLTASADGRYTIRIESASYPAILSVHDGTCAGAELGCVDSGAEVPAVFVNLVTGQTIIIAIDGYPGTSGTFTFSVNGGPPLPTPTPTPGDCCTAHDTASCLTGTCADCVCALDPFCCDTSWDALCVGETGGSCAAVCACRTATTISPTPTPTPSATVTPSPTAGGIVIESPSDGSAVNASLITVTGIAPGANTVLVNGVAAVLTGGSFTAAVSLIEGVNIITATATGPGAAVSAAIHVTLDTMAPAAPNMSLIAAGLLNGGAASVVGSAGSVEADGLVTVTNTRTQETVITTADDTGAFATGLAAVAGDTLSIFVTDRAGNVGPPASKQVGSIAVGVTDSISELTTSGSEITVRGTLSSLPSGTVGVTANGNAGLVEGNQFVVRLPTDPSMTSLTLTVLDFSGILSAVAIPVTVPTNPPAPAIVLRASQPAGLVPLTTGFTYSSPVSVAHLTLDADSDGTIDADETTIDTFTFTYAQAGLYLPRLTVTDADGNSYTTVGIVHAADPTVMDARLQPVWQGVKDALRVGDVTSAAAFMHFDTRADYQAIWNLLPSETLANIDQIMTSVQLTEVSPFSAQYEMQRDKNGQTFSFAVWFQLDQDGLWRLQRF